LPEFELEIEPVAASLFELAVEPLVVLSSIGRVFPEHEHAEKQQPRTTIASVRT